MERAPKVPCFSKHFKTSQKRSALMKKIKRVDTEPEVALRKGLWALGIRYRKNYKRISGSPDIYIPRPKVAIFVDGEFWHGYNWNEKKKKLKSNRDYWIPKIERNIHRDIFNRLELEKCGVTVIRFWQHEIKNDLGRCIGIILRSLQASDKTGIPDIKDIA